jgi:hypothetical protein
MMIVLIGLCGNVLQVLESWRQEQVTAGEPQTGSGRYACHNVGIIGTLAQAVK